MVSASEFGAQMVDVIQTRDVSKSLSMLHTFRESMKDPSIGAEYVTWITEPANLTLVHRALIDYLGISARALAIKRILMSRPQKASLLVQAMEISLKRAYSL